jgi:murein DD-endopeptidase MepM/ murein hydrolase activator NlpD
MMRHTRRSESRTRYSGAYTRISQVGPINPFLRSFRLRARFVLAIVGMLALPLYAAAQKTASRKAKDAQWNRQVCAPGVELRISSMEPRQGSLQLVEMRSQGRLAEIGGKWDGNEVQFWASGSSAAKELDVRRTLIGIDLELATGTHQFAASIKTTDGDEITCNATLTVKDGRFAVEKLTVTPQFVEPNPEQLSRADAERKRLREIFATVTPEKLWNGRFRVPITGATRGGNFGRRRVLNGEPSSPHTGVDFPAPAGTPVHAAQAGRVVLAEPLYFSGNTVILDHGLGVYTLYGHLSAFNVKAGDQVIAGGIIGKVGATGRVTGPHLHWGLTINRARVNSLDIVRLL